MSYAAVAGSNTLPQSQQPHPDPALFETGTSHSTPPSIPDDTKKVNVVPSDFKSHPATVTSEQHIPMDDDNSNTFPPPIKKNKKNKRVQEVEAEGLYLWEVTKHYLFRPGVAGGLIGLVNIGLLAGAARAFYVQPNLRRDTKVISSTAAATLTLLTAEGFLAEKYRKTPRGQDEERRAKEEGTLIYKHLREIILRPGVLGGLLGLVNAAILGTTGYYSYINWDKPTWDRRIVSAVSVGLITLWGGEGLLAERYREKKHH